MATSLNILGTVLKEGLCQAKKGHVSVRVGQKPGTVALSFDGIVVSMLGGASVPEGRSTWEEVVAMTRTITHAGGVIVNGGEQSGVMLASASLAPASTLGIITPYIPMNTSGVKAIVEDSQTRHAILTKLPTVIVFEGGVGTIAAWTMVFNGMKEALSDGRSIPTLYLHDYWKSTLDELWKIRAIPKRVMDHVRFFARGSEVAQEVVA